jgi:hypothetical protein
MIIIILYSRLFEEKKSRVQCCWKGRRGSRGRAGVVCSCLDKGKMGAWVMSGEGTEGDT